VLAAVRGWQTSCEKFKQCYVLPQTERNKMAAIARPAWKDWITKDFKVKPALVDSLWAEVARLEKSVNERDMKQYGQ
jgi:hypothetical protein